MENKSKMNIAVNEPTRMERFEDLLIFADPCSNNSNENIYYYVIKHFSKENWKSIAQHLDDLGYERACIMISRDLN